MSRHSPSTQLVEKKQIFWVSRGFSLVNSVERDWGSDSPVKDELSTWDGREEGHKSRMEKKIHTDDISFSAAASLSTRRQKHKLAHRRNLKLLLWLLMVPNKMVISLTEPRSLRCSKTALGLLPQRFTPLTLHPCEEISRMSAGIRSPAFTSTRSPTTTSCTGIWNFSPPRMTRACCGKTV